MHMLILCGVLVPDLAVAARQLVRVASIDWCPQICSSKERPGYLVEMLEGLFKGSNYDLRIDIFPWSRAIKLVTAGAYDMLLSPAKSEAPDLLYPRDPISAQIHCLWMLKGDSKKIKSVEDLSKIRFIIYRDHSLHQKLGPALRDPRSFIELSYDGSFIERAVQMVRHGRAQAFVFTDQTTLYELKRKKIYDFEKHICFQKDDLWLGFSPHPMIAVSDVVPFVNKKLKAYRSSREYKKILKKYDIRYSEVVPF